MRELLDYLAPPESVDSIKGLVDAAVQRVREGQRVKDKMQVVTLIDDNNDICYRIADSSVRSTGILRKRRSTGDLSTGLSFFALTYMNRRMEMITWGLPRQSQLVSQSDAIELAGRSPEEIDALTSSVKSARRIDNSEFADTIHRLSNARVPALQRTD